MGPKDGCEQSEISFLCVGTPSLHNGSLDVSESAQLRRNRQSAANRRKSSTGCAPQASVAGPQSLWPFHDRGGERKAQMWILRMLQIMILSDLRIGVTHPHEFLLTHTKPLLELYARRLDRGNGQRLCGPRQHCAAEHDPVDLSSIARFADFLRSCA